MLQIAPMIAYVIKRQFLNIVAMKNRMKNLREVKNEEDKEEEKGKDRKRKQQLRDEQDEEKKAGKVKCHPYFFLTHLLL